jgi:two-component system response regulator YesN
VIKVILVDDEPFMIDTIKNSIPWKDFDMEVMATFSNGKTALEYVNNNDVDVIFTDIRMPIMDGQTFVNNVKKIKPEVFIIILSAFDDYHLVRELFKVGVFDYLVKIDLLSAKTTDVLKRLQLNIISMSIVSQKTSIYNFLETKLRHSYSDVNSETYFVITFHLTDKISTKLFNVFLFELEAEYNLIYYQKSPYSHILLFRDSDKYSNIIEMLNSKLHAISSKILAGTSPQNNIQYLKAMLEQSRIAMNKSFYNDENCLEKYDNALGTATSAIDDEINTCKNNVRNYLTTFNLQAANFNITNIMTEVERYINLCKTHNMPYDEFKQNVAELLQFSINCIYYSGIVSVNLIEKAQSVNTIINDIETFGKIKRLVLEYLTAINHEIISNNSVEIESRIKTYIDNKFFSDIDLKKLAFDFGISKNYIGRLFTQKYNIAINQYINNLRIEKAKDLLINTNLRVSEISIKVGYKNVEHFSRIFKKSICFSPYDYRKYYDKNS